MIQRGLTNNPAIAQALDGAQVRITLGADAVSDAFALADAVARMVPPLDSALFARAVGDGRIPSSDVRNGVSRANNIGRLLFGSSERITVSLGVSPLDQSNGRRGFAWTGSEQYPPP